MTLPATKTRNTLIPPVYYITTTIKLQMSLIYSEFPRSGNTCYQFTTPPSEYPRTLRHTSCAAVSPNKVLKPVIHNNIVNLMKRKY